MKILHKAIKTGTIISLVITLYFYLGWHLDSRNITEFANVTSFENLNDQELGKAIETLNARVYSKEGFAKNKSYFLWNKLGATPLQILQGGGDCADKSRLTAAILDENGIDATLVMLKPCQECSWRHTVVEARRGDSFRMAIDPVYNLTFPKPGGGYYGIEEMKARPEILENRLKELVAERGRNDKVAFYSRAVDGSHYGFPATINLERNYFTKVLGSIIGLFSDNPSMVKRPRFLEDPKLFFTILGFGATLGLLTLWGLLYYWSRRKEKRPTKVNVAN